VRGEQQWLRTCRQAGDALGEFAEVRRAQRHVLFGRPQTFITDGFCTLVLMHFMMLTGTTATPCPVVATLPAILRSVAASPRKRTHPRGTQQAPVCPVAGDRAGRPDTPQEIASTCLRKQWRRYLYRDAGGGARRAMIRTCLVVVDSYLGRACRILRTVGEIPRPGTSENDTVPTVADLAGAHGNPSHRSISFHCRVVSNPWVAIAAVVFAVGHVPTSLIVARAVGSLN
jgi:hypothetical protein